MRIEESRWQAVEDLTQKEQEARIRAEQAETELTGKQSELQKMKGELKTEKFKSSAAEAGSVIMDSVRSALGTSKVKRQQQEIEALSSENDDQNKN